MFLKDPVPFEEAARAIAAMPGVSEETFRQLLPEVQALCFFVSGLESLDAVKMVRDRIAQLPRDGDFRAAVKEVAAQLTWLNPEAAERRATLLVRMHGFRAYAAASFRQMEAMKDVFPWRQYVASMDGKTRPHHAALHGKTLPADHPFWANHTGPWEFNCRCEAVPLTPEDVDMIREQDAGKPPEDQRVLEGAFLERLEVQGQVVKPNGTGFLDVRTPRERGESEFEWRAGDMGLPVAEIAARYDAKDWAVWLKHAETLRLLDGRTVREWMEGKAGKAKSQKPKAPAPVPPVPVAAPVPAAAPAARTLDTLRTAMEPLAARWREYAALPAPSTIEEERGRRALAAAINAEARAVIELPLAARGKKDVEASAWKGKKSGRRTLLSAVKKGPGKKLMDHAAAGMREVASVTHPDFLPVVKVAELSGGEKGRAFHFGLTDKATGAKYGVIQVNSQSSVSTVAHEITHGTEQQFPELLKAALDFRESRTKGETVKTLNALHKTSVYDSWEVALEDEWQRRGGRHYMGKVYSGGHATEILTMGIERLLYNTAEFAANDPDYFEFMLKTLQKL